MQLAVCYYPEQWPEALWADDARRMAELGIRIVRIAEFAWGRMEPAPGQYDFAWLDRAIATLAAAGLQIVLGTPTAAPPKWLVDAHPDILAVGANGRTKAFGSRRHYCFSSETFRAESRRIVSVMAQRYGQHPAVIGWQTDNEYGCHDTITSYSPAAARRFRQWLARRYADIASLNAAWNAVFWSSEYASFEAIDPPVATVTDALPAHLLDYRRFLSDEVASYNQLQVEVLRAHSPGRFITHNFMAFFSEFDHPPLAAQLDFASWDNYPLGHSDVNPALNEAEKTRWMRTGHPDVPAFHHDLYRGLGRGRFWVMEQQAGPVNWASWNPIPLPGMVRLWSWEAFAHGAEVVSYFRWRQCPYGQEQMHSGLNTPDNRLDVGGHEAQQVAQELAQLPQAASAPARVALVFDYPSRWQTTIQPQGADFDYFTVAFRFYSALRQLGLDIDIVSPEADLAGHALIVIPSQLHIGAPLLASLEAAAARGAEIVLGARSGSKTALSAIASGLPPGPLRSLMPIRVNAVESLRPGVVESAEGSLGRIEMARWCERVELLGAVYVEAHYTHGQPAVLRAGSVRYLAGWPANASLRAILADSAQRAGLAPQDLGESLRLRRRGTLQFAFNVGPEAATVPAPPATRFLLGQARLAAGELAVWQAAN